MGTNSGSMHAKGWHPYHAMMAQGAENAAAKGFLNGRRRENGQEVIPPRGATIWPGIPEDRKLWAKLNPTAWSRSVLPQRPSTFLAYAKEMVPFDIETRAA